MPEDRGSDEPGLWERAKRGDSAAFAEVYDRHRDRVFGQALRWTRSGHDAEDILALVFLEAWRRRATVRMVDDSLLPWLLVTANHVAQNADRAARRHRIAMAKVPAQEHQADHATRVLDGLDTDLVEARVRVAFAALRPKERDVLTLCVVNEFSLAQAARTLGIPVGTVKSRLSRAKARLASLTGPQDRDDASAPAFGGLK
jgi:RNA polymerase sigma factor (sigma-70 family)